MPGFDIAPALDVITQRHGCTSFPEYVCCGCPWYFHYGIDLSSGSAWDRPQYATRSGSIYIAGMNAVPGQPGLGLGVVLSADDGYDVIYGHFGSLAVSAGQRVKVGDVIGYTGSTGYSTGPHAHIEVRRQGNLNASPNGVQDPWAWLSFAGEPAPEPPKPKARSEGMLLTHPTHVGRFDFIRVVDGNLVRHYTSDGWLDGAGGLAGAGEAGRGWNYGNPGVALDPASVGACWVLPDEHGWLVMTALDERGQAWGIQQTLDASTTGGWIRLNLTGDVVGRQG